METKFYSQDELDVLKDAIEKQINNPARAGVNNESSFVFFKLKNLGYDYIAKEYWSWVCSSRKNEPIFGAEIFALQQELNKIKNTIPDWGTYGT